MSSCLRSCLFFFAPVRRVPDNTIAILLGLVSARLRSRRGRTCCLASRWTHPVRCTSPPCLTRATASPCCSAAQVFCTICPLITPVAAFYFAMNYIVW